MENNIKYIKILNMSNIYTVQKYITNQHILQDVIQNSGFSNLDYISSIEDNLSIYFTNDITEQQKESLSNIVFDFDDQQFTDNENLKYQNISIKNSVVNNTNWTIVSEFITKGKYMETMTKLLINSHISSLDDGEYSVRLYDPNRNKVCGLSAFTNKILDTNEMLIDIMNVPETITLLEVQIKTDNINTFVTTKNCCIIIE